MGDADERQTTIDLGELDERFAGESAVVKTFRPFAAGQQIRSASFRLIPRDGVDLDDFELTPETVIIEVDKLGEALAAISWHVISWTLKARDGSPLPVGRDGVLHEDFDDELGPLIVEKLDELVAARRRSKSGVAGLKAGVVGDDGERPGNAA